VGGLNGKREKRGPKTKKGIANGKLGGSKRITKKGFWETGQSWVSKTGTEQRGRGVQLLFQGKKRFKHGDRKGASDKPKDTAKKTEGGEPEKKLRDMEKVGVVGNLQKGGRREKGLWKKKT